MSGAREAFLREVLALDPEFATGLQRDGKTGIAHRMVWNEDNLREALGIPKTEPAPIIFTLDVPNPLSFLGAFPDTRFQVTYEALVRAARAEVERGLEMGIARQCQALVDENTALKERIFALEGGFSTSRPAAYLIAKEVERAREKYPEGDLQSRMDGFTGETGEALQALVKFKHGWGSLEHARIEVIQTAGQCVRLLEEALVGPEPIRHCTGLDEHEVTP